MLFFLLILRYSVDVFDIGESNFVWNKLVIVNVPPMWEIVDLSSLGDSDVVLHTCKPVQHGLSAF